MLSRNILKDFPKQTRSLNAIKTINSYFESQGNTEREPLPTMMQIVDYCKVNPRLLTLRDSPLRDLHDPKLPYLAVHDWYISISLNYIEASMYILSKAFDSDYRKKRHDRDQIIKLFSGYVQDIHTCYSDTLLALNMPFPEDSNMGSDELQIKVKDANRQLIKDKLPTFFNEASRMFYDLGLDLIESKYRLQATAEKNESFANLFTDGMEYQGQELEDMVQLIWDEHLPDGVDVYNLSDQILKDHRKNLISYNGSIKLDEWLSSDVHDKTIEVKNMEERLVSFGEICDMLNSLLILPDWTAILREKISNRLSVSTWKESWDVRMTQIQLKWLHTLVIPWVSFTIPKLENGIDWNNFIRKKVKAEHIVYEALYKEMIPHIFNIIREYPDTKEAINDFHIIATRRALLKDLRDSLMHALQERLLHQGASATDILEQYSLCIQCLSIIDPSCSIMTPVIDLIETYMKTYRNDVVQGVIDILRSPEYEHFYPDENNIYAFKQSELNEDQVSQDLVIVAEDTPAKLRRLQDKSADPVAMLISMCKPIGSFVEGYKKTLGEVLLSSDTYNVDKEFVHLERLKQYFPTDTLSACDAMLKDIDESKRINRKVHENPEIGNNMQSLVISRRFWPEEEWEDSDFELQQDYKSMFDKYKDEYRKTRASRYLVLVPSQGSVKLELERESGTLTIQTSPEAASVIGLFETKDQRLTIDDISEKTNISRQRVLDCLEFWIGNDIIQQLATGEFCLVEE